MRIRVKSRVRDSAGFVPGPAKLRYNGLNVHQHLLASFRVCTIARELFNRVLSWIDLVERKEKSQRSGPNPRIQSGFHCSYTDPSAVQPFTVQKSCFSQDSHHFPFMLFLAQTSKVQSSKIISTVLFPFHSERQKIRNLSGTLRLLP